MTTPTPPLPTPPLRQLGLRVGHYTDAKARTGLTVFVMPEGASIGIHIAGGSAGTFNTPIFGATSSGATAHAVVLAGGSMYGLASVHGVLRWLEENRIGRIFGGTLVPDVTGAVIFDLAYGRSDIRPTEVDGYQAAAVATDTELEVGSVGVGTGATTGKWYRGQRRRGGFATATVELPHGIVVSAFVVNNSIGDVGGDWATNLPDPTDDIGALDGVISRGRAAPATTLAVVATNTALDRSQLSRVAGVASQGLSRTIHPASLLSDGDTVFALSSLSGQRISCPEVNPATLVDIVGIGAAEAVRQAVLKTVAE